MTNDKAKWEMLFKETVNFKIYQLANKILDEHYWGNRLKWKS